MSTKPAGSRQHEEQGADRGDEDVVQERPPELHAGQQHPVSETDGSRGTSLNTTSNDSMSEVKETTRMFHRGPP